MCSVLDLSHGEVPGCRNNIPKVCPGPAQALCKPVVGAELSLWARAAEAVASLLRAHIPTPPRRGVHLTLSLARTQPLPGAPPLQKEPDTIEDPGHSEVRR